MGTAEVLPVSDCQGEPALGVAKCRPATADSPGEPEEVRLSDCDRYSAVTGIPDTGGHSHYAEEVRGRRRKARPARRAASKPNSIRWKPVRSSSTPSRVRPPAANSAYAMALTAKSSRPAHETIAARQCWCSCEAESLPNIQEKEVGEVSVARRWLIVTPSRWH